MSRTAPCDVLVLDGAARAALAVVRALGAFGLNVASGKSRPRSLSSVSRYCRREFVYPDPLRETAAFGQWLTRWVQDYPKAMVVPVTDLTVPRTLALGAPVASSLCPLPSLAHYEAVSSKDRLASLASHLAIRVPTTRSLSASDGADHIPADLFPAVVKAARSVPAEGGGALLPMVCYVDDREALRRVLAGVPDRTAPLLVQQRISGEGCGIFGLYSRGRRLATFAHRRVREKPITGGVSVLSESVPPDAGATAMLDRLCAHLEWTGVLMAEFKRTSSGEYYLIEINARLWGSLQLAIDSGVDFPVLLYRLWKGESVEGPGTFRLGRRLHWWLGDLDSLYLRLKPPSAAGRSTGNVLAHAASLAWPLHARTRNEVLRPTDLRPGVLELREYVQHVAR